MFPESVETYNDNKGQKEDFKLKRNRDSRKCKLGDETMSQHVTLKTGMMVQDKYPSEEIKLIEIPLKKSHLSLNISDEAFETMADKVGDSFDVKHEKVMTGKEAILKLDQLQHLNHTNKNP